ncbi:DUF488 domain-containing protein [Anaerolineales bacterium HSG25]|nr:DUF488 domain-containing protein [Anaerolineales bacterium HSG25]
MKTVLFRDEIEGADLDIAVGTLHIAETESIAENKASYQIDREITFNITETKSEILPYQTDDTGVLVDVASQRRYQFKVTQANQTQPYHGRLKVLSEIQPKLKTIYTIGYGNRSINQFIALLKQYQILYVADIRTSAYSKYNPDFSQNMLKHALREHGVGYVFMGEQLGGRPKDNDCYTNGKVDYSKVGQADFYKTGLKRINTALEKRLSVALMCSEQKPEMCHRSKLVGETLSKSNLAVWHIDENGLLKTQQDVILRLTKGQLSMFDQSFTSRKNYQKKAA